MESLVAKLKSLGISIGEPNKQIKPIVHFPIDKVINGEWIHDRFGDIFLTSSNYPFGYHQGFIQLIKNNSPTILYNVSKIDDRPFNINDLIFIDTETTGLSGGTGTMVFMLGLGHFINSGFIVNQYFLDNPDQEYTLMTKLISEIAGRKIIISYNGSSFDFPLLNSRFILNRIDPPFQTIQHLDLLHLSRKLWKLRLGTCKLRDIESEILGFTRNEEEVPGWMVPQLYFDFLKTGDARQLKGVFYHNCMDVLSLAAIFIHASYLLSSPIEDLNLQTLDILSIARIFEKNGMLDKSSSLYQSCVHDDIPEHMVPSMLFDFGNLYKQIGQLDRAVHLWELSFSKGNIFAAIELAKYYEHILKQWDKALHLVKQANLILIASSMIFCKIDTIKKDLHKRELRLTYKINRLNNREDE